LVLLAADAHQDLAGPSLAVRSEVPCPAACFEASQREAFLASPCQGEGSHTGLVQASQGHQRRQGLGAPWHLETMALALVLHPWAGQAAASFPAASGLAASSAFASVRVA